MSKYVPCWFCQSSVPYKPRNQSSGRYLNQILRFLQRGFSLKMKLVIKNQHFRWWKCSKIVFRMHLLRPPKSKFFQWSPHRPPQWEGATPSHAVPYASVCAPIPKTLLQPWVCVQHHNEPIDNVWYWLSQWCINPLICTLWSLVTELILLPDLALLYYISCVISGLFYYNGRVYPRQFDG